MLFTEISAVFPEIYTKVVNSPCEQNVTTGGI